MRYSRMSSDTPIKVFHDSDILTQAPREQSLPSRGIHLWPLHFISTHFLIHFTQFQVKKKWRHYETLSPHNLWNQIRLPSPLTGLPLIMIFSTPTLCLVQTKVRFRLRLRLQRIQSQLAASDASVIDLKDPSWKKVRAKRFHLLTEFPKTTSHCQRLE